MCRGRRGRKAKLGAGAKERKTIMPPRVIEHCFFLWDKHCGRRKKTGGQDEKDKKKKAVCLIGPIVLGKATFKAGLF